MTARISEQWWHRRLACADCQGLRLETTRCLVACDCSEIPILISNTQDLAAKTQRAPSKVAFRCERGGGGRGTPPPQLRSGASCRTQVRRTVRAFTLVEIIVAMVITAAIAGAVALMRG